MVYDVVIVGGGIAGLGLFDKASREGLSVALIERGLPGGATTAVTSGLFHGGLRYLPYDVATSFAMCREIAVVLRENPSVLRRQPFLWPVYRGHRFGLGIVGSLLDYYDLFASWRSSRPHGLLSPEEALALAPGLERRGLRGALSFDEWTVDVPRLVDGLIASGSKAGGTLRARSPVISFEKDGSLISAARLAGATERIAGRVFVNAAGPWAEEVSRLAGGRGVALSLRKGVHLVFSGTAPRCGLIFPDADGRYIGLYPRADGFLVGPSDDDFDGRPDDLAATPEDEGALRDGLERVLPGMRGKPARVIAGLRPIFRQRGIPALLSRDYRIYDHAEEGTPNLLTVSGGKLTSHRRMAQAALTRVLHKLGRQAPMADAETSPGLPWSLLETRRRAVSLAASAGLLAFYAARRALGVGARREGLTAFRESYGWPA